VEQLGGQEGAARGRRCARRQRAGANGNGPVERRGQRGAGRAGRAGRASEVRQGAAAGGMGRLHGGALLLRHERERRGTVVGEAESCLLLAAPSTSQEDYSTRFATTSPGARPTLGRELERAVQQHPVITGLGPLKRLELPCLSSSSRAARHRKLDKSPRASLASRADASERARERDDDVLAVVRCAGPVVLSSGDH
jgi:hypothetical protein